MGSFDKLITYFLLALLVLTSYVVVLEKDFAVLFVQINQQIAKDLLATLVVPCIFLLLCGRLRVLWHKVVLGLVCGVIYGCIAGELTEYAKPIGDLFINAIRMVIIPLIFFSLISGITSISDPTSLGRIGVKSIVTYLATTAFAISIGLLLSVILEPGTGTNLSLLPQTAAVVDLSVVKEFSFRNLLVNIIPSNALEAMVNANMLQVVFFAMFTGVALLKMGTSGERLIGTFQNLAKLTFKMIDLVIKFSPYGAFTLAAWVIGTQGFEILYALARLIVTVLLAMLVQYLFFGLFIWVFARISPLPFYKKSLEYQALAFSTSSSKATLATTMKVCHERLGISNSSTSFVLPLGASMNMDATAIYLGICAVFFAQAMGVELHTYEYILITITATIGSIGGAGIPGGSMVMLPMVLSAINLPIEGVALIAGIDRILDMCRTTINITGDATVTLIIDKSEGSFNENIYNSNN